MSIEPTNPVQVLVQLLSFLNQSSGISTGSTGKDLRASLKEASKLLFVPPAGKISFDSDLKVVPILHSFQKKLEKAVDEAQAPRSAVQRGESAPKIPPAARVTTDPKNPQTQERGSLPQPQAKPFAINTPVAKLLEEVKHALKMVPVESSREAPLVKAVAERLIPLLDRLAASLQHPSFHGKAKNPLNPAKPEARDLGEAPKKQVEREQSPEKKQNSHELRRESVNQIGRQIKGDKPNAPEQRTAPQQSTKTAPAESESSPTAKTTPPQEVRPHLRSIISLETPRASSEPTVASKPTSSESHTVPFAVPFFAQSPFSTSFTSKRKKDNEDEKREQSEEEEKEED